MSITTKIWDFPTIPIAKQIFVAPGTSIDGGFTVGGARISSPEPGGRGLLEFQPSLAVREWQYPSISWLMSMTNGEVFRVRLAPTPQIASALSGVVPWDSDILWSNLEKWQGDLTATFKSDALNGSTNVTVDLSSYGQILQRGHVFGHAFDTYLVKDISYDINNVATIIASPPLRRNIKAGDDFFFRPWFTGLISNGSNLRTTYDAENWGNIQLNNIIMSEVVL